MEDNKKQVVEKENVEVVKTENVEKENGSTTNKFNKFTKTKDKIANKLNKKNYIESMCERYGKHIVDMVILIKYNAEIKRFTSIGIINYLFNNKQIPSQKAFVTYKWNKFSVKCNGLVREFTYSEPFFVVALIASFTSFTDSAQTAIAEFYGTEISENKRNEINNDTISQIVKLNKEYSSKNSVDFSDDLSED